MIELRCIKAQQFLHDFPDLVIGCFNQHVKMVCHQAHTVQLEREKALYQFYIFQKRHIIILFLKNSISPVPPAHHMISCSWIPLSFLSCQSLHLRFVPKQYILIYGFHDVLRLKVRFENHFIFFLFRRYEKPSEVCFSSWSHNYF